MRKIATILCLVALFSTLIVSAALKTFAQHPSQAAQSLPQVSQACTTAPAGSAHCLALQLLVHPLSGGSPAGYGPADLQSAYHLTASSSSQGAGRTIAIVDAYDDPNAEADLAIYRSQYGLPACTSASGCFKKINENGGTSYPTPDVGWAEEISLDLDMASAICPLCNILLVEAYAPTFVDLGTAVNTAASLKNKLHVNAISNSYGGSEFSTESNYAHYYNHNGVMITASSGDSGYSGGTQVPAAFNTVTAVGGTSLYRNSATSRGWQESVWSGAGSGCSFYISKQSWQKDPDCSKRTIADVSAVGDPYTGVAVYDSYMQSGWLVFGGTSVSSPIIASVYTLAGNAGSLYYTRFLYTHSSHLYDITSGSNGSCGSSYFCNGKKGYDGPTGLGTPNGTGAF